MKRIILFLGILGAFLVGGLSFLLTESPSHSHICLNMIVKNENHIIKRCLASTLPLIDYWVIVDTGSTDGTQETIKRFMKEQKIPGELHERPWVNFEHNRNEALDLARGKSDYVLFIDADEYFTYDNDFRLPELNKDFYYVTLHFGGLKYGRISLIKNEPKWAWKGVLHEALVPPYGASSETILGVTNIITTEGARSKDPEKFKKDAQVLEAALEKEPHNTRYQFYLAQSYQDAGDLVKAIESYEKRIAMGGWDQEVFCSQLRLANLQAALKMPVSVVTESYAKAHRMRPGRAEPLYYMAEYFRKQGNFPSGYEVAKVAASMPLSSDVLFVERWVYEYGALLEQSINAYWVGKYEECHDLCKQLLKKEDLPVNVRECIERNLSFAEAKLAEEVKKEAQETQAL